MDFLKKWTSCIVSFVVGVCGLILSICPGMWTKISSTNEQVAQILKSNDLGSETTKAFKVLTDSSLYNQAKDAGIGNEFMVMKVFAIITLIVSILLVVYSIIILLKNFNIIKSSSIIFTIIGICLNVALVVATIGLLISSNSFASAQEDLIVKSLSAFGPYASLIDAEVSVGVYQPTMLVISIVSSIIIGTFTLLNKKHS